MFLDSDFNGGSWGNFEEDYNNFGSMGTTISNTVSQMQQNAQNQIDEIQERQNKGKVTVKVNNKNIRTKDRDIRNNIKSISRKDYFDGQMALLESVNADLNMRLQTQREKSKRSNLIMYGLLGLLTIVLLKRK